MTIESYFLIQPQVPLRITDDVILKRCKYHFRNCAITQLVCMWVLHNADKKHGQWSHNSKQYNALTWCFLFFLNLSAVSIDCWLRLLCSRTCCVHILYRPLLLKITFFIHFHKEKAVYGSVHCDHILALCVCQNKIDSIPSM